MDESKILNSLETFALDAAYGRAMLEAHALEMCLANLLIIGLVDRGYSNEEYQSECSKIKKKTMGRLISGVVEKYEISDYWREELDNCLFFRNRLAHQISDDIISSHISGGGKDKLIIELDETRSYFTETKEEMEKLIDGWLEKNGIEKSVIKEAAMNLVKKAL